MVAHKTSKFPSFKFSGFAVRTSLSVVNRITIAKAAQAYSDKYIFMKKEKNIFGMPAYF